MTNIYLPQPPPTKIDAQLVRWFIEIWKKLGRKGAVLGALKFGDPDNNTEFEDDGTLKLNGTATVWNDINLPGGNLHPGATAPTWGSFFASGGIEGYLFAAAINNMLHATAEILHDYKEGSDIIVHIHWMPSTTNTGVVRWGVEYNWLEHEEAGGAPTTIYVEQAGSGVAWANQKAEFAAISGAGKTMGSSFILRVFRDATHANDTFTGTAGFIQLGIHYETDTIGSRGITTK